MSDLPIGFSINPSRDVNPESVITNYFFTYRYINGLNVHGKKITVDNRNIKDYNFLQPFFDSFLNIGYKVYHNEYIGLLTIINEDILINTVNYANFCNFHIFGEKSKFEEVENLIYSHFEKYVETVSLRWCFLNDSGKIESTVSNLEEKNPPFTEMYPFLKDESLHEYYERYYNSSASILLLQGPAGTGKTTFIRGLLHHLKKNAILSYDDAILKGDNFLRLFINDASMHFLIFEDADAYLTTRESGNRVIHKFLNAGDGLISSPNKKLIFTTNLPSITDIDSALIRPGRCHDILQFRNLTKDEAIKVAQIKDLEPELQEKEYTIAEIFNTQSYTKKKVPKSIGFDL